MSMSLLFFPVQVNNRMMFTQKEYLQKQLPQLRRRKRFCAVNVKPLFAFIRVWTEKLPFSVWTFFDKNK